MALQQGALRLGFIGPCQMHGPPACDEHPYPHRRWTRFPLLRFGLESCPATSCHEPTSRQQPGGPSCPFPPSKPRHTSYHHHFARLQTVYGFLTFCQLHHSCKSVISVDVKLRLQHHPPWPPKACSPRFVSPFPSARTGVRFRGGTLLTPIQQFESKSSRAKGIAFHPKR